jgi:uncharacterized spore protein YtfJ
MAGSGIGEPMDVLFGHLEGMLKAKTVFGEPIAVGDVTLIPVVDITFGAAAGGTQEKSERAPGAGGGAGARVTAAAVIVVRQSQVQVMKLKNAAPLERLLDYVPEILQSVKKDRPAAEKPAEE